ncbi:MAG: hypothetical protein QNI84_11495 [Henriciella sp.]|nr:hypothetical protein [Henriciella sp.]
MQKTLNIDKKIDEKIASDFDALIKLWRAAERQLSVRADSFSEDLELEHLRDELVEQQNELIDLLSKIETPQVEQVLQKLAIWDMSCGASAQDGLGDQRDRYERLVVSAIGDLELIASKLEQ